LVDPKLPGPDTCRQTMTDQYALVCLPVQKIFAEIYFRVVHQANRLNSIHIAISSDTLEISYRFTEPYIIFYSYYAFMNIS
jgi:hypothetical protein